MPKNGQVCCILGVCCRRAEQEAAIAQAMVTEIGCSPEDASKHAHWLMANFDLAPAGSLESLKSALVTVIRNA